MHKDATNLLVSTVKENHVGYTEREYQRAKLAQRVYHLVGAPTIENFKHILRGLKLGIMGVPIGLNPIRDLLRC
jgi:hypothetical protein